MFGTVAGGIWLWVGLAILVITLLYWGREEMRDYGRMRTAGAAGQLTAGALPAPVGTPPAGRPHPAALLPAAARLDRLHRARGLDDHGRLALVFGFLAVVITAIGWLWDSRREYAATEEADRTGHLDLGGAPAWPKATFAALAIIVGLAILLSSGILGGSGDGTSGARGERRERRRPAAARPRPSPSAADADVVVVREHHLGRDDADGAGRRPFTLALDNRDTASRTTWSSRTPRAQVFKTSWSRDRRLWSTMCRPFPPGSTASSARCIPT